jgi:hypothetical protein
VPRLSLAVQGVEVIQPDLQRVLPEPETGKSGQAVDGRPSMLLAQRYVLLLPERGERRQVVGAKAGDAALLGLRVWLLWVVVQLASFKPADGPFMHNPSLAQVRWQAWTAVAYGAKSISYWTTGTTPDPNPKSDYRGGLLELDGRISSKYKAIRQLNAELHALGPTLMELDPVAVLQVDGQGQFAADRDRIGSSAQTYDIVTAVDGTDRADCLIGYFRTSGPPGITCWW